MAGIELVLYVTGEGRRASEAVAAVERLRAEHLADCALTVVDTTRQPEAAAADSVRVTPTLIRRRPQPERRVVGDLGDAGAVRRALGLGGE
jgi:circadian clock protein KaiB